MVTYQELDQIESAQLIESVIGIEVVIGNGESLSNAVDLHGFALLAIQMPAAWDAADLTLQGSADRGVTFDDIYDEYGSEVTVQATVSRYIVLSPQLYYALDQIKVRSGTSGTPVNQGADRTLKLLVRAT
jgi:hypothetical protein